MSDSAARLAQISDRLRAAEATRAWTDASGPAVRLLAVSKTRTAAEVRAMAAPGQCAFGENYVQEAIEKQRELADLDLEWHLIGHLQSNKAREAAEVFDWIQSVNRIKLVAALARHRPAELPPLNVLIQVNLDGETSKSGCRPDGVSDIANAICAESRLVLRGLMAIPAPDPDFDRRRTAFRALKVLFEELRLAMTRTCHESNRIPPSRIDTLSMGMSEDFELAIAEGATLVRVGTALFGPRLGNRPT
jgi:pyridoxal phosphate enzyme (YggS family)